MAVSPFQENNEVSNPVKRIRWATHRAKGPAADKKRQSLMNRLHNRVPSVSKRSDKGKDIGKTSEDNGNEDVAQDAEEDTNGRKIYANKPLPADMVDEEGHPTFHYARNKIRTAKYTALSFIPKNLYFQLHNIANIYFLFIVVLGFFSIFGVENPGLNAVPIIVILVVTAIKDAIEDWRRSNLDNELNNASIYRLADYHNVNSANEHISLWRKFKKANTRMITWIWRSISRSKKEGKGKTYTERALDERPSVDTTRPDLSRYQSAMSQPQDEDGAIQMTPVPSPLPGQTRPGEGPLADVKDGAEATFEPTDGPIESSMQENVAPAKRFYGNVINPDKDIPNKARFKPDTWKNVKVGDFVRIYNNEEIPADLVVLSTSDADGQCYVETKNLDGETNLKVRQALHCSRKIKHARHCEQAEFVIDSEGPHANLYAYSAVMKWNQRDPNDPDRHIDMAEPVSINNLLLRGCSLRNTEWALGMVVFAGQETKIMINSGITPSKRAKITRELNWNVVYNFIILFAMCLVAGIVQGVTWGRDDTSHAYFEYGSYGNNVPALDGFITFWAAVILFQNLVPISLYISLEIIRVCQAYFIYSDILMYYEKLDYPCTPKTWNISDDLGQVEYIFSDKTGTLTQNVMEFKKVTINGEAYGEAYTEAQAGMQRRQGIDVEAEAARAHEQIAQDKVKMLEKLRKIHDNPYLRNENITFVAPDFVSDLAGESGPAQKAATEQFMLALALCHTVITERTPGDPPTIEFKAQSPDEAALVATARDCGFTVIGRNEEDIIVNVMGEDRTYRVLNTLEFNSSRKRMSAIVRMPDHRIMLFCKGADSMIYSRLTAGEQKQLRTTTAEHLEMFAREGLRTLCIAQREISEEDYQRWNKEHDLAAAAVQEREEKLEAVSDAIERDLTLLGGTAIEDRLQDGVPDAIALLGRAGIKLWVLTGDKVETAINIGFSCNLLSNDMDLIVFKIEDESLETAERELNQHLQMFGMTGSDEELKAARKNHEPPEATHAVVIDGDSLKLVLDEKLKQKFLLLCKQCKSVLCCRVSPSQKAAVVNMVKYGLDCLTLSIGDGANDVAMIQEADIGVGIAGEEGRQAVMSSDFAIGQFRYLTRLVVVHGRWSYRRLAETVANFFYKNIVWTFVLFWYNIYNNFDCAYIYDYTYVTLYNLAFTSLPVILMGVLDQDVGDKIALAVPQLYRRGIERLEWTQTKFWLYMFDGLFQSVIIFFMTYLTFYLAVPNSESGLSVDDTKRLGVYVGSVSVTAVNLYVLMNTYRWDWLILLITAISILLIWFWTGVYTTSTYGFQFYKAAPQVYSQLSFWCVLLLGVIIALLPRFVIKSYQKIYRPYDIDIIREQDRLGAFDDIKNKTDFIPHINETEKVSSLSSSDLSSGKATKQPNGTNGMSRNRDDEDRPIYPPSVAPTATTHNPRSQNGSDGTDYTGHDSNMGERPPRPSIDRPRPSFDRMRMSMDKTRPSFEASHDFTSANRLMRLESSESGHDRRRSVQVGSPLNRVSTNDPFRDPHAGSAR